MSDLFLPGLLLAVALACGHLGARFDRPSQAITTDRVCWREAIRRGAGR